MAVISSLLLDRDGTLIEDKHYLANPGKVALLPGVGDTLGALTERGMRFFMVSNQSGIGRGMFPEEAAVACNQRMAELLKPYGVAFTDMLFCPHAPEDACDCRKPGIGMWLALKERHGLEAEECLMLGDKPEDIRFAANAGIALRGLVYTGKGENTAKALGIDLPPGRKWLQLVAAPPAPEYPHIALTAFRLLPRALDLYALRKDMACGA